MAIYTNNVSRVTGFSGMDVDNMVDQLMRAESAKLTKLQQSQQKLTWKQEAYRTQISNINNFRNAFFSASNPATNFRYTDAFKNFQSTVMNGSKESGAITVTGNKASGSYKVQVAQLASNASKTAQNSITKNLEGAELTATDNMASNMTENDTLNVTLNGKTATLKFDDLESNYGVSFNDLKGMSAEDANKKLGEIINDKLGKAFGNEINGKQKVGAEFKDNKLVFTTASSGYTLSVTESTARDEKFDLDLLSQITFDADGKTEEEIKGSFTVKVGDVDYTVSLDIAAGKTAKEISDSINSALKKATYEDADGNEKTKDITGSLKSNFTAAVDDVYEDDGVTLLTSGTPAKISIQALSKTEDIAVSNLALETFASDGNKTGDINVSGGNLAHTGLLVDLGLKTGQSNQLSTSSYLSDIFGSNVASGEVTFSINDKDFTVDTTKTTLASFMNMVNNDKDIGVNITFNSINNTFNIEAKNSGAQGRIDLEGDIFGAMGFTDLSEVKGEDAVFSVDGVWTSRSTNNIDVNGFKFTINETTTNQAIDENDLAAIFGGDTTALSKVDTLTVNSKYDVDATFDKIKSFVEEYNKLISLMTAVTSERRAKTDSYSYYEPLTDEQKDAMTEKEIEKWEGQAKTGLLYNDDTLKSITSKMRQAMYEKIDLGDGTSIAIHQIGITTSSDLSKSGQLIIDEEKLRAAIEERGSDIEKMFTQSGTGLADKLDKIMDGAVGANGTLREKAGIENTSSVNENMLSRQLKALNKQIEDMKEWLYNKEVRYYKTFTAMENAMSQNDSQLNMLLSSFSS